MLLILGQGFSGRFIADAARAAGLQVQGVKRTAAPGILAFDDPALPDAIARATHILSSVPPAGEQQGDDPVLQRFGPLLQRHPGWLGYLSSTGVYGDTGGAWVDESAPIKGRRGGRNEADAEWLSRGARVFRLPGIYGPGRSALDRVRDGKAHRIDLPDQVFSRVHVDDLASGVIASFAGPAGVYNLADDEPCHQNRLIEWGCAMLGAPLPPLQSLEEADLSPAALAFYAENRRIANGRAKRLLGWTPRFPTYREGLAACR